MLVVAHAGVVYQVEAVLGSDFQPLPNLGGRWVDSEGDGPWRLGERVVLVDPDEITVPVGPVDRSPRWPTTPRTSPPC